MLERFELSLCGREGLSAAESKLLERLFISKEWFGEGRSGPGLSGEGLSGLPLLPLSWAKNEAAENEKIIEKAIN